MDARTFVADSILPKIRDAEAAAGIRVILPYMDARLMAWSLAWPVPYRRGEGEREIMRSQIRAGIGRGIAPERGRPKAGFHPWPMTVDYARNVIGAIQAGPLGSRAVLAHQFADVLDPDPAREARQIEALYMLTRWLEEDAGVMRRLRQDASPQITALATQAKP